jgi:hypothetical protein
LGIIEAAQLEFSAYLSLQNAELRQAIADRDKHVKHLEATVENQGGGRK